jgi:hypothetical protein
MKMGESKSSGETGSRRQYLASVVAGGAALLAGCSVFDSSRIPVSVTNNDDRAHTVAVSVRSPDGETLFDREAELDAGVTKTFDGALSVTEEMRRLVAEAAVDGESTTREFRIGGATGTSELVVNVKRGGEVVVFVAQD